MKKSSFAILLIVIFTFGKAQEEVNPVDLFPGDQQLSGWILKDSIKIFSGDDLFPHVGEASGMYNEFGFNESFQAVYVDDKAVKITLDIFQGIESNAAWGIFMMNSSGIGKPLQIGDACILYDYHIHLVKERYFIKCSTSFRDSEHLDAITDFALYIADHIPSKSVEPAIMKAFDFSDISVIDRRYFKGQIALNDIYEFGHGSIAGFEEGGSSRFEQKNFFVFSYSTERKRREWFASMKGKMNMNHKFKDYKQEDDGITVKDRNGTTFSFKPHRQFILVARGYSWKEVQLIFDEMKTNLDKAIPKIPSN